MPKFLKNNIIISAFSALKNNNIKFYSVLVCWRNNLKMIKKISFKPSPEQDERLKNLSRYVNLSQLMRDSLDIVLSNLVMEINGGRINER